MIVIIYFKAIICTNANAIKSRITILASYYKSISADRITNVFSTVPAGSNLTKIASVIRIQVTVITCFPSYIPRLEINLAVSTETNRLSVYVFMTFTCYVNTALARIILICIPVIASFSSFNDSVSTNLANSVRNFKFY